MSENTIMQNEVLLTDVSKKIRLIKYVMSQYSYQLEIFLEYLALKSEYNYIISKVSPKDMLDLIHDVISLYSKEWPKFAEEIVSYYICWILIGIDKVASKEFAKEFKERFFLEYPNKVQLVYNLLVRIDNMSNKKNKKILLEILRQYQINIYGENTEVDDVLEDMFVEYVYSTKS